MGRGGVVGGGDRRRGGGIGAPVWCMERRRRRRVVAVVGLILDDVGRGCDGWFFRFPAVEVTVTAAGGAFDGAGVAGGGVG